MGLSLFMCKFGVAQLCGLMVYIIEVTDEEELEADGKPGQTATSRPPRVFCLLFLLQIWMQRSTQVGLSSMESRE